MADETYKITVNGPGLSLERDVTKQICDRVVILLLTGQQATDAAGKRDISQHHEYPPTSIREFLDEVQAKRMPDKITSIASYMEQHEGRKTFKSDDLIKYFEAAGEAVPKNLSRDLKWAIKSGWITEKTGEKGTYYVTKSGKEAVGHKFAREIVKKTKGLFSGVKKGSSESK